MRQLRNTLILIAAMLTLFPSPGFAVSLRVSWNANTDEDLEGYKVYYGTQPGSYGPGIDVNNVTSYQIDGLSNGTTYYVAVTAHDVSQNESGFSPEQNVSIPAPDTTPPTGTVAINSGAASTTSASVTLSLSATDAGGAVTGMRISNDGVNYGSEIAYTSSCQWTLSGGYGTKTVHVLFKDTAGNWMTSAATDTIEIVAPPDTTPPTGSVVINSGGASTTSRIVTLTLSASDAGGSVTGMKISNDGTTYSSEIAFADSYTWTLPDSDGIKTVSVVFKDAAGNWMSSPAADTIELRRDSDGDGMPDAWETAYGLNPNSPGDAFLDADNDGVSNLDEFLHSTNPTNAADNAPVVSAGPDRNVAPQRVILDGSASYDPNGDTLSHSWAQVSGPVQVLLETPTSSVASFMGIKAGLYRFRLSCSDGRSTVTDTVDVTIQNVAPSVNAGSDTTVNTGTPVTLHATGSDPNEDQLTYQWAKVSGPSVTLPSLTQQNIAFTPSAAGLYTFSVRSSDGVNTSAADQVNVTVNAANRA
ncbi:MAG: fibronectin type III domain-containing protein, partial [Syntrophaceae bacterium]